MTSVHAELPPQGHHEDEAPGDVTAPSGDIADVAVDAVDAVDAVRPVVETLGTADVPSSTPVIIAIDNDECIGSWSKWANKQTASARAVAGRAFFLLL